MTQKPKKEKKAIGKEIKSQAYTKDAVEIDKAITRSVVPYDDIVKALKEGSVYVMPRDISKHTLSQALKKIRTKHELPKAKLGWTKETSQRVFYSE